MKFYKCNQCETIFTKLIDKDNSITCCEEESMVLENNEDIKEKQNHIPHIRKTGNFITVTVGNNHPMVEVHFIEFVCLETNKGVQFRKFSFNQDLKADFILAKEEEIKNVYVYCNLHGLSSLK